MEKGEFLWPAGSFRKSVDISKPNICANTHLINAAYVRFLNYEIAEALRISVFLLE